MKKNVLTIICKNENDSRVELVKNLACPKHYKVRVLTSTYGLQIPVFIYYFNPHRDGIKHQWKSIYASITSMYPGVQVHVSSPGGGLDVPVSKDWIKALTYTMKRINSTAKENVVIDFNNYDLKRQV